MRGYKQSINRFRETLVERGALAEQIFSELCQKTLLGYVGERTNFAIVGGAVRDVLLSENIRNRQLCFSWNDIDIALVEDFSNHSNIAASKNAFGGHKLHDSSIGALDIWTWAEPGSSKVALKDWLARLENVDFGLNAVAFVWPQAKILFHQRWIEDLQSLKIERLSSNVPNSSLQPVRAIALASKMEKKFKSRVRLGEGVKAQLKWLVQDASASDIEEGLSYLKNKVDCNRWSYETMLLFFEYCDHYAATPRFEKLKRQVFESANAFNVSGTENSG